MRPWSHRTLAGLLVAAGLLHFVHPEPYDAIVPDVLPMARAWTWGSGAVEIACGLALLHPGSRRAGATATAVLFAAVLPANVQMSLDLRDGEPWAYALSLARLPLQLPLICWALSVRARATRRSASRPRRGPSRASRSAARRASAA